MLLLRPAFLSGQREVEEQDPRRAQQAFATLHCKMGCAFAIRGAAQPTVFQNDQRANVRNLSTDTGATYRLALTYNKYMLEGSNARHAKRLCRVVLHWPLIRSSRLVVDLVNPRMGNSLATLSGLLDMAISFLNALSASCLSGVAA